jgi:small subunit ribosomal protein S20
VEDILANLESAKKRIRQNVKRRARNRVYRTRARTHIKRARGALATGELDAATSAVQLAAIELDRAASKGVIHRNNAARRKGRLMKQLAALKKQS